MNDRREHAGTIEAMRAAVEEDLKQFTQTIQPVRYAEVYRMIAHHLGWRDDTPLRGGKRLRPLLVLLCCQANGVDWRTALPAATSVELIHNFSLIHDDIEDQSETRRGRLAMWKKWGIAQAINTGDAIFVLSRLSCLRLHQAGLPPNATLEVLHCLDHACLKLTMGQHLDLLYETRDEVSEEAYLEMIEGKTASLLAASAEAGALIGAAPSERAREYRRFGHHLGLAFQIQDDILGIWGSPETTGKPAADDLRGRKKSFPVIYGLQRSRPFVEIWSSQDNSAEAIHAMIEALEEVGALASAQRAVRQHTGEAEAALQSAEPVSPAGVILNNLAQELTDRVS